MRRNLATLLAGVLLAGGVAVLAPTSASASPVCVVAVGTADLVTGLLYPVGTPLVTTSGQQLTITFNNEHVTTTWTFGGGANACPTGAPIAASGTLQGYCGHSTGTGTDNAGHFFWWTSIGGNLLVTGELIGVVRADPNPFLPGNTCFHAGFVKGVGCLSCLPSGALTFIVNGAVLRINCTSPGTLFSTLFPVGSGTSTLVPLPTHVPFPQLISNVHVVNTTFPIWVHLAGHVCTGTPLTLL